MRLETLFRSHQIAPEFHHAHPLLCTGRPQQSTAREIISMLQWRKINSKRALLCCCSAAAPPISCTQCLIFKEVSAGIYIFRSTGQMTKVRLPAFISSLNSWGAISMMQ
ncbi:hypothetical protein ABW19_dt0203794 [Dactylella cylindrospora]|nr:hypothetical protein ABW19_dt0203794 [Dactylella cylindrospora]